MNENEKDQCSLGVFSLLVTSMNEISPENEKTPISMI